MRRRGELRSSAGAQAQLAAAELPLGRPEESEWSRGQRRSCHLPGERRLSVAEFREAEVVRRGAQTLPVVPTMGAAKVPLSGPRRQQWLREALLSVLQVETQVCPPASGSTSMALLAIFERATGEHFQACPGVPVGRRVAALAKVLGNIVAEGAAVSLDPPLVRVSKSGSFLYNRAPMQPLDAEAWQRSVQLAEDRTPARSLQSHMTEVDAGLAEWVRNHAFLRPVPVEEGESGMALLFLWEVDHGCPFPSMAGASRAALLTGFTRRLKERVARDDELKEWLVCKYMQVPLSPGLPTSHHCRWSVRISSPPGGLEVGWYRAFTEKWKDYLQSLAGTQGACEEASSSSRALSVSPTAAPRRGRSEEFSDQGPSKHRRAVPPARQSPSPAAGSSQAGLSLDPAGPSARTRVRGVSPGAEQPPRKRQATLSAWLQPQKSQHGPHGRANQGPPT